MNERIEQRLALFPELIAAALKLKEVDLFLTWTLLKAYDKTGGGKISVDEIRWVFIHVFGVDSNHAYAKIKSGIGAYWSAPGGVSGQRVTCLMGRGAVIGRLKPTMSRSTPFLVTLKDLRAKDNILNGAKLKKLMVSLVAARNVEHKPISIAAIMEHTGLSESTVRNSLRDCEHMRTIRNFARLSKPTAYNQAKVIHAKVKTAATRIVMVPDGFIVAKQIPNSYLMTGFARGSRSKRPAELKHYDRENHQRLSSRLYTDSLQRGSHTYEFMSVVDDKGKGGIWKSPDIAEHVKKSKYAQSYFSLRAS